jgi:hypothetical protein
VRKTLTITRRNVLLAGGAVTLAGAVAVGRKWRELQQHAYTAAAGIPVKAPQILDTVGAMPTGASVPPALRSRRWASAPGRSAAKPMAA